MLPIQYSASELKIIVNGEPANSRITVNGEPRAISSSRYVRDAVRESFFVVERGTGSTADYRLDAAYDDYPFQASWSLYHDLCCCCPLIFCCLS
jgi:hypothetical protein